MIEVREAETIEAREAEETIEAREAAEMIEATSRFRPRRTDDRRNRRTPKKDKDFGK